MKKILISLNDFRHGGIPRCLHSLLKYIDKGRYRVEIICLDQDGPYKKVFNELENCKVLQYNFFTRCICTFSSEIKQKGLFEKVGIVTSKIIWKLIKRLLNIDLLDLSIKKKAKKLSGEYDACIAYAEGNCAKLIQNIDCRRKLVWIHNDYNFVPQAGEDTNFELFDKICCVSESTRISFIKKYPCLANNTTTIYNLINHLDIRLSAKEKIEDINFTNDCFSIMSIGRISYQKQFTIIPDIAKKIADKFKFKWYIIGDGPEWAILERKVKEYNLEKTVILLGKQNNPYKYLAQMDLYALTSIYESYPTVINEALVLNIPIISNDIPSIYEMIDETQGFVAPIDKWVDIISGIISNGYSSKEKKTMDFESFNENIMQTFYKLIES